MAPEFNFPISVEFLEKLSYGRSSIKKLSDLWPLIEKSYEEEEIVSTQFEDVKYYANNFVSKAYDEVLKTKPGFHSEEDMDIVFAPSNVHDIKSYAKKLTKIKNKDTELYQKSFALTQELYPIFDMLDYLKKHMVKASDKKKKEAENVAKEKEEYLKKLTSHADYQEVFNLLKEKASGAEKILREHHVDYLNKIVAVYKEKSTPEMSDYHEIFKHNGMAQFLMQSLTKRVDFGYVHAPKKFELIPNYREVIEEKAQENAKFIVEEFVHKNAHKLAFVLYTKDNMKSVELKNLALGHGYIECDLDIKFKDSSAFIANTSVVLSYSKYNKPFYRYPTIFKNVIMPDGLEMTTPSEQKMDEVFAVAKKLKLKP